MCEEAIEPNDVIQFVITRGGGSTESFVHSTCLEDAMDESETLSAIVLHD